MKTLLALLLCLFSVAGFGQQISVSDIVAKGPQFDVRAFGARGDGSTDDTAAITSAVNAAAAVGGTVYFPAGKYKITAALPLKSFVRYKGETGQAYTADPALGSIIIPSGAIWAFASTNTAVVVKGPQMENLTIDMTSNNTSLGAINLTGVGVAKLFSPRILMPNGGSGVVGILFGDPSNVYGYFNDVYDPYISAGNNVNNHIGFYFTSVANDHHIFGGATERVGRPVLIDNSGGVGGGNTNHFFGTGFENFQAHAVQLGNGADHNDFNNNRSENSIRSPFSLTRAANMVTAKFAQDWNVGTAYSTNAVVYYTDGNFYKAVVGSTGVTPGTDATKWAVTSAGHQLSSAIDWYNWGGAVTVSGSTGGATSFNGTFSAPNPASFAFIVDNNTLQWSQVGPNESATTPGSLLSGDFFWAAPTASYNEINHPNLVGMAQPGLDQSSTTYKIYQWSNGGVIQLPGTSGGVASMCVGASGCNEATGYIFHLPGGTQFFDITGIGGFRGVRKTDGNGSSWLDGTVSETITLSTSGTTTDSVNNLLPQNSVIKNVSCRVQTTITGATAWSSGDATTPARFIASQSTLTSGFSVVGLQQVDQTGSAGPKQTSAAKLRITTTGTPTAGAIKCVVWYNQFVAPTL